MAEVSDEYKRGWQEGLQRFAEVIGGAAGMAKDEVAVLGNTVVNERARFATHLIGVAVAVAMAIAEAGPPPKRA